MNLIFNRQYYSASFRGVRIVTYLGIMGAYGRAVVRIGTSHELETVDSHTLFISKHTAELHYNNHIKPEVVAHHGKELRIWWVS